ncbi:MAG: gamma-glutamyltransferase [Phycisphaerales bacterium]
MRACVRWCSAGVPGSRGWGWSARTPRRSRARRSRATNRSRRRRGPRCCAQERQVAACQAFTLSVVRPYSCSIGGGGFMVIHLEDDPRFGDLDIAINYRETCPAGVGATYYEDLGVPDASTVGGTAVAVPARWRGCCTRSRSTGRSTVRRC